MGPIVVFLVLLVAETAAAALAHWPSSEILWYLNLEVFGFVQQNQYFLGQLTIAYAQLLLAGAILAMALIGYMGRLRLFVAVPSNLSFLFVGATIYCNCFVGRERIRAASLDFAVVASQPSSYLLLCLLLVSAVSFVISHVMYWRLIPEDRGRCQVFTKN
jgi:hypothetical protein